jgi:3-deoxy-D-manno-octulosonate cytidylyltransferase
MPRKPIFALLPARLGSTRFPEKMLADLAGKPLIVRSCEAVKNTGLFDQVLVVTDHERIREAVQAHGCDVVMSREDHPSGSDRIAEIAQNLAEGSIIINVQGDEPFTQKAPLEDLIRVFDDPKVLVASLMTPLTQPEALHNPNVVKVAVNGKNDALYFSRAAIPYKRDDNGQGLVAGQHFQHIGIYAYRRETLLHFTSLPPCPLELTEKLEQLRLLYNGISIRMVVTDALFIGVDTEEDLVKARERFINEN